jgi:hypothetical protein
MAGIVDQLQLSPRAAAMNVIAHSVSGRFFNINIVESDRHYVEPCNFSGELTVLDTLPG